MTEASETADLSDEIQNGKNAVNFPLEEWRALRRQLSDHLRSIWYKEVASLVAVGFFYSWLLSPVAVFQSYPSHLNPDYLLVLPPLFMAVVTWRLTIEYRILMRMAQYIRRLEWHLYDRKADHGDGGSQEKLVPTDLHGWQTFLNKNRPEDIGKAECFGAFSQTFYVCLCVIFFSLGYFLFVLLPESGVSSIFKSLFAC